MNEKASKPTGNHYMFICDEAIFADVQMALGKYLADFKTDGTYLYSKAANNYVKVGATYNSYEYMGNTITFTVDRTFTREYNNRGFAICIDLTADMASGKPAIAQFSLKGADIITNKYPGVNFTTCAA